MSVDVSPVLDTSIVVQTQFLGDDKRYDTSLQALPEHQQSPHTSVAVLERMDAPRELIVGDSRKSLSVAVLKLQTDMPNYRQVFISKHDVKI